ncbi:hypothetical protein EDB92DRAFT_1848437 [Lactarius akahatsu]|uniref:Uncharacterized protein n=1 Tax=Lactarius akahatsu TaxID=416441 RepID=A0AAD4LNS9_9AGAM|nr:hypothetical protein EDB92DRAFT_1848437 [Lactarius akahatsu]
MPLLSRLPNLISSSLSSAPQEPLIASQKAQIDQLGQKTRTLELTISRLREQLSDSRSEWQTERTEWAGECETVMACHRIAHLETNVLLSRERIALEYERDLTRKERVAVVERDYHLILSKAREKELEIELKEKATLLHDAEKAREAAELKANHSQAELSALQAQLSSANTHVDRLTLRLEDAQTALAEKERLNNEIQQEKAALKAQVGQRKSPDERGEAEQCATLEGQIKHLESRVTEEQNKASTHEKALQKERKNTEKLQLALDEQIEKATNAEEEASLLEQQSREYKDELEKALWQVKQLKADTQPDGPTSRSRVHSDLRSDEAENINPSASKIAPSHKAEVSDVKSKKTTKKPYRGKDAPTTRKPSITDNKGKRKAAPDNEDTESIASDDKAAKSTKPNSGKNKTKPKVPPAPAEEDDETNDVAMPKKKKMRKLNITNPFASAQPHSLDWANQYNVGDGGLDIPTELSPVKVPARSLAGKSASTSFWKG